MTRELRLVLLIVFAAVGIVVLTMRALRPSPAERDAHELDRFLGRCNKDPQQMSSIERDPCRLECFNFDGKLAWKAPMSESICAGLH